jgi:hypothetical protein
VCIDIAFSSTFLPACLKKCNVGKLLLCKYRGVFEVHRAEKVVDLYDGIQAHLSTCASPKVLDVVSKFPQKIKLDEVPRISTWPRQFLVTGAKEENIALYFFAKNFER